MSSVPEEPTSEREAYIEQVVASIPPMTDAQRSRVEELLSVMIIEAGELGLFESTATPLDERP